MDEPRDDIDTGRPIAALRDLVPEETPGFFDRLRKKIDRRIVTHEFVSLGWDVPRLVLKEFLEFVFQWFQPAPSGGEENDEGSTRPGDA